MEVTRQDFMSYEDVRLSGVTNMFDVKAVEAYSGLSREVILEIMEHYSAYRKWLYDGKYASMAHVINGTHGIGTILANYDDIVAVYGKPFTRLPENKIDVQWVIETKHGVATLYNYKDGKAYLGEKGLDARAITQWHIGGHGHGKAVFEEIQTAIHDYTKERIGGK